MDIMDTENLDQVLNLNCSLNRLNDLGHVQNLSCDTLDTKEIHSHFGFIPKGPLRLYHGDPGVCNRIPDIITAHLLVKICGLPNYLGCRVPVASNLNCQCWSHHLQDYWDKQLPDLL